MVKLGIIGIGGMGSAHATNVAAGKVKGMELAAVCDRNVKSCDKFPDAHPFTDSDQLLASDKVDAVLIATPHYDHTTIGIAALKAGKHVLVEKPISVHKADCERLIAAHTNEKQVFAAMFNQRTDPYYQKLRSLIQGGELGQIRRINWIITNWFRTEMYYKSGGWRATWAGEGGGVLLNQCPHQLDLYQWLFGMPDRVRAFCTIGRYHDIEVEDDVTAYLEYNDGTKGVFITSTGEAPGSNRLEVVAEQGKVVIEDDKIRYTRNEQQMTAYSQTTEERFVPPSNWNVEIPVNGHGGQHVEIMQNFADAILEGKELIAPAAEGIRSVELGNAMLQSSFEDRTIELPVDASAYEALLKKKIESSTYVKKTVEVETNDLAGSF